MRSLGTREAGGMAENREVPLDRAQVKKAVQALQAFLKSKSSKDVLLLDNSQPISLLFTLWKIPRQTQTIRIPLPHGQRSDTDEVCLFTKDEPRMTAEQTQRFYKKLLEERGVRNVSQIIPFKTLKTEYKPYEAKRRLLGNFDMFLSDERIRRLLPSHLGKHFYTTKKMPISINLQSLNLGRDVQQLVQGTSLTVNNRGSCSMAHVAHSNMTADEVTENVEAAVRTVATKLRMKGPIMKLIHLKSQSSAALPIYTSDLSHISVLQRSKENSKTKKVKKKEVGGEKQKETTKQQKKKQQSEEEEEIPQLVPIETPSKRPKMEKSTRKKRMQKPIKPAAAKKVTTGSKVTKATTKATRKDGKVAQKGRRKVRKGK